MPISVFFDEISDLFAAYTITANRLLITGDFNIHVDEPEKPDVCKCLQIIESFGLKQHVSVPTHVAGHTLDFVITRDDCDFLSNSPQAHFMMSSHSTVLFKFNWTKPHRPAVTRSCRKIKEIDLNKFPSDLHSSILLQHPTENVHDLDFQYQSTLLAILDDHTPIVSMRVAQRPCQPWFCCETADAKKSHRRLERKWRRTGADRPIFVEALNNVSKLISAAKTSFYSRRIEKFSGNQKVLFREMNHLLNKKTVPPLPPRETPLALADQFAAFFQTKLT